MTDPIADLIDGASEALRASMHIPPTPDHVSDLYRRAGNLVDLLGKLGLVVGRLDQTLTIVAQLCELDSDDDTSAGEHVTAASVALQQTKVAVDRGCARANKAHSALSHLMIR